MNRKHLYLGAFLATAAFSVGFYSGGESLIKIGQQLELFSEVYKEVNTVYADEVDPTRLMRTSIDSMLDGLDPYTVFVGESRIEDAKFIQTGRYSGVGIQLARHGESVIITQVVQDGPADKAGIQVGDELIQVDQEVITGPNWKIVDIDNLIQGEQGASVQLTIQKDTISQAVEVVRDYVAALEGDVSYYSLVNESVGYIKLDGFGGNAAREVKQAYDALNDSVELSALVLDLRGNLGGRVDQAIGILNLFIPKGINVLEMRGSTPQHTRSFTTPFEAVNKEIPLAVLIDESSASASEIVAGAIQDLDRGVVVGEQSFGKGLVQNVRPLSYNTQFRITVAKYYTPSGRCIQAIDYGNRREDGSLIPTEERQRNAFSTLSGRKVFDGAGIEPDFTLDFPLEPEILAALREQHLIFDYVTNFSKNNDSIAEPQEFQLSDKAFKQFLSYLEQESFSFHPKSEEKLEQLSTFIEEDPALQTPVAELLSRIEKAKSGDLKKHEAAIRKTIQKEIIRRYYYKSGLIQASFARDKVVLKATEILLDSNSYQSTLEQ